MNVSYKMAHNVLHKTSKGMRDMNHQDTQQFERDKMPKLHTYWFYALLPPVISYN